MQETIIIIDFGSQYTQLIARRLRELNVFCEIQPFHNVRVEDKHIKGFILSGSPHSVLEEKAPQPPAWVFDYGVPILGVCYGAQYLAHSNGGIVQKSEVREYGRALLSSLDPQNVLMKSVPVGSQVWMSHGDTIKELPEGFNIVASTEDVAVAAYQVGDSTTFGIQFHPEVYHSTHGAQILRNFVVEVCQCTCDWTPTAFVEETVEQLREKVGDKKVVLGLSGGVDSTVAAVLLHKAIGDRLHCIFVNNGLLRKNEYDDVLAQYEHMGLNVKGVNASSRFLSALAGESEPEAKRKIIGRVFIEVFDDEANAVPDVEFLGQGTIYPDVIESVSSGGPSVTIKSHHNVGGLPDFMKLSVVEPLRMLFKDEVRRVGASLGISPDLLGRHPFPGPGLAIRILGDITEEKVRILQEVDHIFIQGLKEENLYDKVWQAGAILLPVQSVGVMGDERTYERVVALRAVESTDGMTADWVHLPYEFLARISNKIINRVKGVNRVVYDISSKPPATIEWE
ncbi:MAG: glutamine-hydrolyzing GMP synthase [Flavobacteriales bacterium]|nr:MAG: glutamine-hydrolyzing GMP synthase [Flavobacteriales bacterium]